MSSLCQNLLCLLAAVPTASAAAPAAAAALAAAAPPTASAAAATLAPFDTKISLNSQLLPALFHYVHLFLLSPVSSPPGHRCWLGWWGCAKRQQEFLTLRVSPPAHPETMPRRVEVIREVGMHTEKQRAGSSARQTIRPSFVVVVVHVFKERAWAHVFKEWAWANRPVTHSSPTYSKSEPGPTLQISTKT